MGVQDEAGRRLGKAKLAEGIAGIARLHELLAEHQDQDHDHGAQAQQVVVGIETDRLGPSATSSGLTRDGWVACRRRSPVSPRWRSSRYIVEIEHR